MAVWKGVAPRKRNRAVLYIVLWFALMIFAVWVNFKDL